MAFRKKGRGGDAMLTFTAVVNIPLPMSKYNYDDVSNKL